MGRWQYAVQTLAAHIDNPGVREYIRESYPEWKNPPKYAVEALEPILNEWGSDGWELVHMEPIAEIGNNGDIGWVTDAKMGRFSNTYFCVFKRFIPEQ